MADNVEKTGEGSVDEDFTVQGAGLDIKPDEDENSLTNQIMDIVTHQIFQIGQYINKQHALDGGLLNESSSERILFLMENLEPKQVYLPMEAHAKRRRKIKVRVNVTERIVATILGEGIRRGNTAHIKIWLEMKRANERARTKNVDGGELQSKNWDKCNELFQGLHEEAMAAVPENGNGTGGNKVDKPEKAAGG